MRVCAMQMCVELVIAVVLRNRDRLLLIWPYVHDFLAAILAPAQVLLHGVQSSRMTHERLSGHMLMSEKCSTPALCQGYCGGRQPREVPLDSSRQRRQEHVVPAGQREAGRNATGGASGPGAAAGVPARAAV